MTSEFHQEATGDLTGSQIFSCKAGCGHFFLNQARVRSNFGIIQDNKSFYRIISICPLTTLGWIKPIQPIKSTFSLEDEVSQMEW